MCRWSRRQAAIDASDRNFPEGFRRRTERLISYFGINFTINFSLILFWASHKCILKLLNVFKYLLIIPKLSYVEKNVWPFIFLGLHLREEVNEGALQCQRSSQYIHWDALGWSTLLVTLVLRDISTTLHAYSLQSYFFQHICPICFI